MGELKDKTIKTSVVKNICGNDEIVGRQLYKEELTVFQMRSKFLISTNTMPEFSENDFAIKRRVKQFCLDLFYRNTVKNNEFLIKKMLSVPLSSDIRIK